MQYTPLVSLPLPHLLTTLQSLWQLFKAHIKMPKRLYTRRMRNATHKYCFCLAACVCVCVCVPLSMPLCNSLQLLYVICCKICNTLLQRFPLKLFINLKTNQQEKRQQIPCASYRVLKTKKTLWRTFLALFFLSDFHDKKIKERKSQCASRPTCQQNERKQSV